MMIITKIKREISKRRERRLSLTSLKKPNRKNKMIRLKRLMENKLLKAGHKMAQIRK